MEIKIIQMRKTYKELISNLEENQIFVFGSNPVGINGNAARMTGGAALIANLNGWVIQNEILDNCVSITGKSYGITTVSYPGKRLSKTAKEIIQNISKFYDFALINPDSLKKFTNLIFSPLFLLLIFKSE